MGHRGQRSFLWGRVVCSYSGYDTQKKAAAVATAHLSDYLLLNFSFFLALLQSGHLTGSFSKPFSL